VSTATVGSLSKMRTTRTTSKTMRMRTRNRQLALHPERVDAHPRMAAKLAPVALARTWKRKRMMTRTSRMMKTSMTS
jgi:hypothetical protein